MTISIGKHAGGSSAATLIAVLCCAPIASAAAGQTSQGEPASAKRAKGAVKVSLGWRADCGDGGESVRGAMSVRRGLRLRRGRFAVSERGQERGTDGVAVSYRATLTGRSRGRTVKGTWRLVVTGAYEEEGRFTCDTGPVSFPVTAKRTRRPAGAAARGKLINLDYKGPGKRRQPAPPPAPPPAPGPGGGSAGAGGAGDGGSGGGGGSGDGGSGDGGPAPGPLPSRASGRILYHARDCNGVPPAVKPLARARVLFADPRTPSLAIASATTAADGSFTVPEGIPADANDVSLLVDSERIAVVPQGDAAPYRIRLGPFTDGQALTLPDGPRSGVANILAQLNAAADLAHEISSRPPPKVTAFGRWTADLVGWAGDQVPSFAWNGEPRITVGGRQDGSVQDAWERYALTHEYGHQVNQSLTGFPPGAGGSHNGYEAFPEQPELPYTEGFANFYAALIGGPKLTSGSAQGVTCRAFADLDTRPATALAPSGPFTLPTPGEKHWAQYQEMNVGAAFYHAAQALSGSPKAGAAAILGALGAYKDAYAVPSQTHDARDAITDFAPATTEVEQKVGEAFADQGISYGISVEMDAPPLQHPPPCPPGSLCPRDPGAEARITGPGGVSCHRGNVETQADQYFAPSFARRSFAGPLAGRHDDCYEVETYRVDSAPNSWTVRVTDLFWDLPFLANNAHRDAVWNVDVRLDRCGYGLNDCPYPVSIPVRIGTGRWHRPGESPFARVPRNQKRATVQVSSDAWVTVARFKANGACEVVGASVSDADCGVGRP